jgi:hypothetical protein
MCLSEGVYKVVDFGVEKAAEILAAIIEGFPPGLVTLKRVEWSQPGAHHRWGSPAGPYASRGAEPKMSSTTKRAQYIARL